MMSQNSNFFSFMIFGALIGLILYSIYTAFGPASSELLDPFDEHED
uniref:Photosystem II protein N n=1 Tax=Gloeochaete wittrockiana TaxID=38269 RepID=A0A3G1IW46_9EUKA|nr:photosystem II protein N [Gloeochaete wittrockiana]ASQ40287.1 photosystem II protein N [Gloeochaete wittrockiana]